jgi:hypothetical protein
LSSSEIAINDIKINGFGSIFMLGLNMLMYYRFVQQKLGGPSISDYEKLKAEKLDLQLKYNELLETQKETSRQVNCVICLQNTKYAMLLCPFA